eukprot:TRINITY_DN57693_c0_g1_i1.p1 TRINITY_DN57693_c0_g1~~TRINITY_DN57693_c0_g1_i1.p1  ORF type:complete len:621 (-),score=60.97 TRINITY_DN57693_c0_g1_i1:358-2220(-)
MSIFSLFVSTICLWNVVQQVLCAVTGSMWLDFGFIPKPGVELWRDGTARLVLNVTDTTHVFNFYDADYFWSTKDLPLARDKIYNIGILNDTTKIKEPPYIKQAVKIWLNLKPVHLLKYKQKQHTTGERGSLVTLCSNGHMHKHNWNHDRRAFAIAFCERENGAKNDKDYLQWAQHTRDNHLGLEITPWDIQANGILKGKPYVLNNEISTLQYDFTVGVWLKLQSSAPVFWQGAFVLVTVTMDEEKDTHRYTLFLSSSTEVYTSKEIPNPTGDDNIVHLEVARQIKPERAVAKICENGEMVESHYQGNVLDGMYRFFDQTNDVEHDLVLGLEMKNRYLHAQELDDWYQSLLPDKPKEGAVQVDDIEPDELPAEEDGKSSRLLVNGIQHGGYWRETPELQTGMFTLGVSVRGMELINKPTVLLVSDTFSFVLTVRQEKDTVCVAQIVWSNKLWVSNDITCTLATPIHLALVHDADESPTALHLFYNDDEITLTAKDAAKPERASITEKQLGPVLSFEAVGIADTVLARSIAHVLTTTDKLPQKYSRLKERLDNKESIFQPISVEELTGRSVLDSKHSGLSFKFVVWLITTVTGFSLVLIVALLVGVAPPRFGGGAPKGPKAV